MGFTSIPRLAKVYLVLVCLLGIGAAVLLRCLTLPESTASLLELGIYTVLAAVAGGQKIPLTRKVPDSDAVSMSLGFVITFAGMLRFGPGGALALGALSCLSGCVYPKTQPPYQIAFNVSLSALEATLGSLVYLLLNGWTLEMRPVETFIAVAGSTLTSFAVNTGGVALIISLCSQDRLGRIWRDTFLWTAPSYFAGASISALAMVLFGHNVGYILLFVAPVAYLTYQSYAVYMSRSEEKRRHAEEVEQSQARLADLYLSTIKSLALAIDAKDQYTHQHILRVQRYAVAIAKEMGMSGGELEAVNTGALLHDIGKLGVPEYVLLKPGRLTDEEFEKIKRHPEIGASILDPVEFPWPVLPVVKYHHEKWDGSGYPEGLKGEDIPLSARIMAVADVYDALTSSRSYRSAWTHERAIATIHRDSGSHFDPAVVEAFDAIIENVIREMAEVGEGPLAPKQGIAESTATKAGQAAEDIARVSSELWALYEVAPTLSANLGVQETIYLLARRLEAIYTGVACVFLLRDERGGLTSTTAIGSNREFFVEATTIGKNSLSLQVAETGQSYLGPFDPEDLMLSGTEAAQWAAPQSCAIVPIVCDGEALGTINLYHPALDAFNAHDLQRLEMIAGRAATAIYNGLNQQRSRDVLAAESPDGLGHLRDVTGEIEQRCETPDQPPFAILCLDLNSFKAISENFGTERGDAILGDVATLLRAVVGGSGTVVHYGPDEFLIILDHAERDRAVGFAELLESEIEQFDAGLVHFRYGALKLGVSVGISCFPEDGNQCAELLAAADKSMYQSKSERLLRLLSRSTPQRRRSAA